MFIRYFTSLAAAILSEMFPHELPLQRMDSRCPSAVTRLDSISQTETVLKVSRGVALGSLPWRCITPGMSGRLRVKSGASQMGERVSRRRPAGSFPSVFVGLPCLSVLSAASLFCFPSSRSLSVFVYLFISNRSLSHLLSLSLSLPFFLASCSTRLIFSFTFISLRSSVCLASDFAHLQPNFARRYFRCTRLPYSPAPSCIQSL